MIKLIFLAALIAMAYFAWKGAMAKRSAMTPADARALLGVSSEASLEDVREAHRRLIAKVHPDSGGSAELASRVNLARDTLVGELSRVG